VNPLSKSLFAFSIILLVASCATRKLDIDYDPLGAQYSIIPETKNKLGAPEFGVRAHITNAYELGGTSQSEIIFSSNPSAVSISTNEPTQHAGLGVGAFGSLGVVKYVDAIAQKSNQGLWQGGINVCLLVNCGYDDSGWKASLYYLAGYQSEDETSSDQWFTEDDLDDKEKFDNVSGELKLTGRTAGVTLGYRKGDELYYTNLTYAHLEAESTVTVVGQSPVPFRAVSETYGALLGLRSYSDVKNNSRRGFYFIEAGYNQARNRGTRRFDRDGFMGSFGLGMSFL
jgi:hypothetical protein